MAVAVGCQQDVATHTAGDWEQPGRGRGKPYHRTNTRGWAHSTAMEDSDWMVCTTRMQLQCGLGGVFLFCFVFVFANVLIVTAWTCCSSIVLMLCRGPGGIIDMAGWSGLNSPNNTGNGDFSNMTQVCKRTPETGCLYNVWENTLRNKGSNVEPLLGDSYVQCLQKQCWTVSY